MEKIMQCISVLIVLFAVLTVPVVADSPPSIICQATIDSFDVRNVAVDSNDNIIVSGREYLAKFDSACNELWTIEREDKDFDDVAVDPDGNIIAVYNSNYDIIICKYTPSGAESWCKQYDFNGWGWSDSPEAVAVDSNGDIIVVGQASERESPWRNLWIVFKISGTTKNVLWTDYFEHDPPGGAVSYATAEDVVIDSNDYVIVTGYYKYYWGFYDDNQMLTIKYSSSGDRYCEKHYGTADACEEVQNYAYTVTVDSQGSFIIGGGSDYDEGDVIKYSSNCQIQWVKVLGWVHASAITSDDGIIMASSRVCLFDSTNGDVIWSIGFSARDVAVDSADNIIAVSSGEIVKYGYAQPDLTITRIWFNENPCCAGDDIEIIFDVTNQGGYDAGSHRDCLYIDSNKVTEFSSSGLNTGDTTGWYYLYENVPSTPNPPVIEVCTDCNDDVEESDGDNNCDSDNLNVVTPIMTVNPTNWNPTINRGESDSEIVTVSATGGPVEGVTVSKVAGPTWLSVSPTNLGDISSGSSKTFTMTASPPAGTSGDFAYKVRVSNTCGTPSSIDVTGTITVPCPELSYLPTSHDFGDMCEGVTDSTTFELWNSGTGTLTYSLSETCSWVEVNPTSGSSTGEHDTITVDIDITGLSGGSHTCDISIGSNGGSGTFTVTVNIIPCENILINPGFEGGLSSWSSTGGSATYLADATNHHTGLLSAKGIELNTENLGRLYQDFTAKLIPGEKYKIGGWIKTENVDGHAVIALDYVNDGGWCPADGYVKEVGHVTGTNDWAYYESNWFTLPPMPVDCSMLWFLFDFNVGKGTAWWDDVFLYGPVQQTEPELSYSPTSYDFGDMCEGVTDSTTFEIWNSGTGTLTYSLSESCGWMDVHPSSGSSTGEHDTITVKINTTGLSEGPHTCDISIGSNGGSGTFTVTVNVVPLCTAKCAVYQAGVPDPEGILNPLRELRDEYLKEEYVDRYYDYCPELTMVVTRDPALAYEAARLLVKYSPMVKQEVYGIGMDKLITRRDVDEIVSFTNRLKRGVWKNRDEIGVERSLEIIKFLDEFKGQIRASEGKTFSEALQGSIYCEDEQMPDPDG